MLKKTVLSTKDFAFDTLLVMAIQCEKLNNGKGTEDDPAEGTGFQPGQGETPGLNAIQAFSSPASHSLVPLPRTSLTHTMHNLDAVASDGANSESAPDSETTGPTTHKQKHKSKAMIAYKKLAFNKCQATDRQCTKDSLDPDVNVRPKICKRHVASSTFHCSA